MRDLSLVIAKSTRAVKRPEQCILKRVVAGTYDPSTGSTVDPAPVEFDCEATFSVSAGYQFDQYLKTAGDLFARIDEATIQTIPQAGDTLHVLSTGDVFNIVLVKPFAGLGGLSGSPAFLLMVRK